jgi:lipopolysaccharide transport system ATP-binding protein
MKTIINVHHLSKQYQLTEGKPYYTLRDNLTTILKNPLSLLKRSQNKTFWALKDLNFTVNEGEILGILGNNGAGKSTLLKVLSRITPPTKGEITIEGRLGSLLEVGTGFHPELSGRENIYLNGAILGMTRAEVESQFDTIVEFAEVEKFLDTPMKHYSSGMYMRLAFAVAAHLQSEIILVDEVLAVGDIEFQKKCLGKMGDIAKQGRTILFVSHNMGAVQQLCSRCIVLEKGKIIYTGETNKAIGKYLEHSHIASTQGNLKDRPRGHNVTLTAKLEKITLRSDENLGSATVDSTKSFDIDISFRAKENIKTGFYLSIKDENRRPVLLLSSGHLRGKDYSLGKGKHTLRCHVDATHLTSGRYSIDCGLTYPNRETVDSVEDALFFTVTNSDPYKKGFDYSQQWGSYHVHHEWKELKHAAV